MLKTVLRTAGIVTAAAAFCMAYGDSKGNVNALDMVLVKGGTFMMGCTAEQGKDCVPYEKPAHKVTVGDFYISKYEATQLLWKWVMGGNPSFHKGNDNLPVEMVTWDTVQVFIERLNAKTGKAYRLPTEAEWEYAARGGNKDGGKYKYSGGNSISEVAWYKVHENETGKTYQVGTKKANGLGIYDMSGNVWEWVSDYYSDYTYADQTDPTGPYRGIDRVARGGSWGNGPRGCRVSYRASNHPKLFNSSMGFRLALSVQ